jgi:penicillin-binding protein 1A
MPDGTEWKPPNYSGTFRGNVTLRETITYSINVPAVKLQQRVGTRNVIATARRMGIRSPLRAVPSLTLGTNGVTLLELTSAYAILANQGIRHDPIAIKLVTDRYGRVLERNQAYSEEVLSAPVNAILNDLFRSVADEGTGYRMRSMGFTRPAAGKTGTTDDWSDAWFLGYTPDLVAGVWVGFDLKISMGRRHSGGVVALPLWTEFMKLAHEPWEPTDFPPPEGVTRLRVCQDSGLLPVRGCREREELFITGTEPVEFCTVHRPGGPERPWDDRDEFTSFDSRIVPHN